MYAYTDFNLGNNNIQCKKLDTKFNFNKFQIFKKALLKYKFTFFDNINLNYLVICENLKINNISTAGIPNNKMSTLIFDFGLNELNFERALHHEIFHMIQSNYDFTKVNLIWKKFNLEDFEYAGCSTCTNKIDISLRTDLSSFITEYSMSAIEEDQAEIYSAWMTNNELFDKLFNNNKLVIQKKNILLKFINNLEF